MSKTYRTRSEDDDFGHPSQDTSHRFSRDALLRENGFCIRSRPADCESVWERNGKFYSQSEAFAVVSRNR